ncbi:glycosyltransferase [Roseateles sp.]|uniref:glycosyltransferase n=1 Tax=Roseateles sp. TaxID=1971397 RepID=UPI003D0F3243
MSQPRMVFHHPHPVRAGAQTASGVRPFRMLEAFAALGYAVDAVVGTARERAQVIATVRARLRAGERYDFMYSESSTEPTLLTEPHHLPLHPTLDFGFMRQLKAAGVPLGLFYRDVYWRFPGYGVNLPRWKRAAALWAYHHDLRQYRSLLDRLYLPSLPMSAYVPEIPIERVRALPPGHGDLAPVAARSRKSGEPLHLLYVGGMGANYPLHRLLEAVHQLPQLRLTVCTREAEWRAVAAQYPLPDGERVRIVHASGAGLIPLYEMADVCVLFVQPQPYWTFAVPVKQFEYIGMGLPILASEGTLSGDFVRDHGVGWTLPYDTDALLLQLQHLVQTPDAVAARRAQSLALAPHHSWLARSQQVASDLRRPG